MARANGVRIANRPRNLTRRNNFARHGFYGGNTLMLDILGSNRAELDVGDGDFAAAIEATRATLQSAAEIRIEEATLNGDELLVRVRVTNNTGHKLPTSYPSRRVYVHLTVADPAGATLFESGRLNKNRPHRGRKGRLGHRLRAPLRRRDHQQVAGPGLRGDHGRLRRQPDLHPAARLEVPQGQPDPAARIPHNRRLPTRWPSSASATTRTSSPAATW